MAISTIRKRNGELADFDRTRIEEAILAAATAVNESDKSFIPAVTDFIVKDLDHVYEIGRASCRERVSSPV